MKRIPSICLVQLTFMRSLDLRAKLWPNRMCNAKYSYWYCVCIEHRHGQTFITAHIHMKTFMGCVYANAFDLEITQATCASHANRPNEAIQNVFSFDIEVVSGPQTHKHLCNGAAAMMPVELRVLLSTHTNCIDLFPITETCFYWIWAHN